MSKARPPAMPDSPQLNKLIENLKLYPTHKARKFLRGGANRYPIFLYKYMADNTEIDYFKCILLESDFYLSSCKKFNDPFDITAQMVETNNLMGLRKRFTDIVSRNHPNIKASEKNKIVSDMMFRNDKHELKRIFRNNIENAGIYCLSGNSKNILMWSHYANNHKGLVFQFNRVNESDAFYYAVKMEYLNEYPKYDVTQDPAPQLQKIILRKAKGWDYENEWRVIRIGGATTYQPFSPQALTGVIFGCKAEKKFKDKIHEILKLRESMNLPAVKVYYAQQSEKDYKLNYYKK